jgi:S-adenosyl-L-methionine hydrolase (adenosine-forming)
MATITLTTDFGNTDWFVGSMKGVIYGIQPGVNIVDITHEVPPGDIRTAAFMLMADYKCFPRLTVHVAVVDPGVGSDRPAIAVRTTDYHFVGPDNGVLSWALRREKVLEIRRLENAEVFRQPVSATFHGRDVFAPVAARLSQGVLLDWIGPEVASYEEMEWPVAELRGETLAGQVLYVDRFGNAITNMDAAALTALGDRELTVVLPGGQTCLVKKFYAEVEASQPIALLGSTGFLEIAINTGHAAKQFNLKVGTPIEVR